MRIAFTAMSDIPDQRLRRQSRIEVRLVNGQMDLLLGSRSSIRTARRYRGAWHIRDHGLVPLRGRLNDGTFFT